MPEAYLKMKESFMRKGMSTKAAKSKAARIYNAKHPGKPVTRNYERMVSRHTEAMARKAVLD